MHSSDLLFPILFHVGNAVALVAFLLKDQLYLRVVLVVSLVLQGVYYFAIPSGPLYDPLLWKIVLIGTNLAMIVALFRDRIPFGFDGDLEPLFKRIKVLTHGQFRRLIATTARIRGHEAAPPVLVHGEHSKALYYVISGTASVRKHGHAITVGDGTFLGEIAFLTGQAATATVTLNEGAECLVWETRALATLLAKEPALDIAMRGLFNHDLAAKVSASTLAPYHPEENGEALIAAET